MASMPCAVDGCERATGVSGSARGLCRKHYLNLRSYGNPLADQGHAPGVCSIDGCEKPAGLPGTARGWCRTHYQRWQRTGDPLVGVRRLGRPACKVDGCTKTITARGYCPAHYVHWKAKGTPTPRFRGQTVEGRRICARCREDLLLEAFGKQASRPDGISSYCKPCQREIKAEWLARNPGYVQPRPSAEQRAAEAREWRRQNPERARELSRNHTMRRRAVKYGADAEKFSDLEIYERDGWVCQICKEPIDRSLRNPHPFSPSIDHRVPLARHGRHTRENCRASHLRCNLRKHAKLEAA